MNVHKDVVDQSSSRFCYSGRPIKSLVRVAALRGIL